MTVCNCRFSDLVVTSAANGSMRICESASGLPEGVLTAVEDQAVADLQAGIGH